MNEAAIDQDARDVVDKLVELCDKIVKSEKRISEQLSDHAKILAHLETRISSLEGAKKNLIYMPRG